MVAFEVARLGQITYSETAQARELTTRQERMSSALFIAFRRLWCCSYALASISTEAIRPNNSEPLRAVNQRILAGFSGRR
jgi:hypothetical protein